MAQEYDLATPLSRKRVRLVSSPIVARRCPQCLGLLDHGAGVHCHLCNRDTHEVCKAAHEAKHHPHGEKP